MPSHEKPAAPARARFVTQPWGGAGVRSSGHASEQTDLLYDGRSFLADSTGPSASVTPVYSSEGLLHALVRPDETVYFVYLGDRPVAQVTGVGGAGGSEELLYLTTDHLGTPMLATDASGAIVWSGGFEPFGGDWNGAGAAGVALRFPGQWEDSSWSGAGGL